MTDETAKGAVDETVSADVAAEAAIEGRDPQPNPVPSEGDEQVSALKSENAELRDRYLRLAAEMDNLRRRTEREVKDAKSYSVAGFARDMLGVSDNLRRTLEAIPPEAHTSEEGGFRTLVEGVEMTERSMLSALERHGVRQLQPVGQKFDPNFHQAMFEMPNPDVPNNTVVQVVQAGYAIGERVLRPAMVGVAKGGPKADAGTDAAQNPLNEKDA